MSEGSGGWFVRARGRVLGPFTWSQLATMRDKGRLVEADELSQDRRSWTRAADMPGVFGPAESPTRAAAAGGAEWPAGAAPAGDPITTAASSGPCWFIARGNTHQGPFSIEDLQRMIDAGTLSPNSLVWKNGMPDWIQAGQVPGLWFAATTAASPARAASQANPSGSPASHPAQISALAISSLVLGLLWLCGLGSLLATIFGAVSLNQIGRSNGTITGRGMALAGLILGIVGLSVAIGLIAFGFLGAFLDQARAPR